MQGENHLELCSSLSHLLSLERFYSSVQPQLLWSVIFPFPHTDAEVWRTFTPGNNQHTFNFSECSGMFWLIVFFIFYQSHWKTPSVAEQSLFSYSKLNHLSRIDFTMNSDCVASSVMAVACLLLWKIFLHSKGASNTHTHSAHVVILVFV